MAAEFVQFRFMYLCTTPSSHTLYSELSHVKLFCLHVCCYLQHQQVSLQLLQVQKKNYIVFQKKVAFKLIQMRMRYYMFYLEKQSTLVLHKQEMTDDISNVLILEKKTDRGACFIHQATVRLRSCPTSGFRIILQIFALLYKVYPGKSREQQVGNSNKSLGFCLLYKTTNIRYLFF